VNRCTATNDYGHECGGIAGHVEEDDSMHFCGLIDGEDTWATTPEDQCGIEWSDDEPA
jgi:hypothetical protein